MYYHAGTWTVPVCDTGKYNWNIQYDEDGSRYGRLPCCCGKLWFLLSQIRYALSAVLADLPTLPGTNCQDTKDFVKAANMQGSQVFLRGCYEQLKSVPDIDFESIDYGYGWENSFKTYWAWANDGIRAGLVIGMIVGGPIVLALLIACCARMCRC